jgi:hypothetical protein
MVHLATASIAFVAVAVGEVLLSLRFREDPRLAPFRTPALVLAILAVVALLALFLVLGRPHLAEEAFGLAERLFLALALAWMLLVSVYLLRSETAPIPSSS